MDKTKRAKLIKSGWHVGTSDEFLGLTAEESAMVRLKLALSDALRVMRTAAGLTQRELAKRLGSSQSRVAKMEAADSTVTMDLLVRAYLALGATAKDLARTIAKAS